MINHFSRRDFLKFASAGAAVSVLPSILSGCNRRNDLLSRDVPSYLGDYKELYMNNPHQAAIEWFKNAEFGLFIHYGLYSMLGGEWQGKQIKTRNKPMAEWIQYHGRIPVAEYAKLKDSFTAKNFNADYITDVALAAGMKYVNLTTRHHDSFCLFDTKETGFNSLNSPAKRDLVGEMSEQCDKKGLGLFLYYSHGRDWRHPHAPTKHWGGASRPNYENKQPEYLYGNENIEIYADFMQQQITELLTQYGPIAGIWLDGESVLKKHAKNNIGSLSQVCEMMRMEQLYSKIKQLQPSCLISYKQGVLGTEDFFTPERHSYNLEGTGKPMEICTTLQSNSWGYNKFSSHRASKNDVMKMLDDAQKIKANLLLNTGPQGDGSFVELELKTLLEVGKIRRQV